MATLVLTDLHLGARSSILSTPAIRERLIERVAEADQVVLLGDVLALRSAPVHDVLAAAQPFLRGVADAFRGQRVVIVPGNHDHRLAEPLLEQGAVSRAPAPLGLERVAAAEGGLAGEIARRLAGCDVEIAYPGLWIRPDVYAIHGHYLDCHFTVPRPESLLAAGMEGIVGRLPAGRLTAEEYEEVLAPIYAFAYRRAQSAPRNGRSAPLASLARRARAQGWRQVKGVGGLMAGALAVGAVAGLNRARLGPFHRDLSVEELGRAGIRAMAEVVERLGVDADHVIFGHTHRAETADGLINAGSWVHERTLIADEGERSPYWPGRYVTVGDFGPPQIESVMAEAAPA
jgi:predicted phosphodiesterase